MKLISVKKGQILQSKGDLNSNVYIVKKGLLRSYSIDDSGKEHIFMFAPEDWIVADGTDTNEPTKLFIDALEESEVMVSQKNLELAHFDALKLIKRITVLQNRIIMLMSSSAIERYQHFLETYPQIVQRVPQRMIASYLGITPEALSKVKNTQAKADRSNS